MSAMLTARCPASGAPVDAKNTIGAPRILDRALRLRVAIYCLLSGPCATNADLTTLNEELGEAMVHARVVRTRPASHGSGRTPTTWPDPYGRWPIRRPTC